ncbi:MAG TPA: c-type cytochrome [bacterium]|nr:c-type cytochrome [bacterium]
MRSRVSIVVGILTLGVVGCAPRDPGAQEAAAGGDAAVAGVPAANALERGKYLVAAGACNECHTPFTMGPQGPMPDMSRMLSGHPANLELSDPPLPTNDWIMMGNATNTAFAGPWGITYSINLTPHETGLGVWTEEMFVKAIREGKHMGAGRPILPPMPWASYGQMTDDDLRAIFAYLKTIPPIDNAAPQAKINPPPSMPVSAG